MTSTQKNALIIFVRTPLLGKVKTRLAATVGNGQALKIYVQLLQHTKKVAGGANSTCFVFYADEIQLNDMWPLPMFSKKLQANGDLGHRMQNAFEEVFAEGYQKVCIVGSDCPGLTTNHIDNAFELLNNNEVVIGPSYDGGYYLLAMKILQCNLFKNIPWSTAEVMVDTISKLNHVGTSFALLTKLSDVDTEGDWLDNKHLLLV